MKLREWVKNKYNIHYLLYISCTLIWYFVNLYRVNGTGGQWAFINEFIGFSVFLLLAVRYGIRSFLRPIYVVPFAVFVIAFYPVYNRFAPNSDYNLQFIGRYINALLCVILLMRAFFYFFKEEKKNRNIKVSACFFIWAIMMLACVASKNESTWPMWGIVALGSAYIIPMSKEENNALVKGIVDGIVINFFIYQGLALLHSPYNIENVRYCSFFSNSDCSAKFFTVSYIGFLVKYLLLKESSKNKVPRIISFMLASSMWAFLFFTNTRSGFVGMFFATFVFMLIKMWLFKEKRFAQLIIGVKMLLVAIISIPIVFVAIRYIPALRHHPIFNVAYSESLVHSWDPINSDKYVEWADVWAMYTERDRRDNPNDYRIYRHLMEVRDKYIPKVEIGEEVSTTQKGADIAEALVMSSNGERVISYVDGVRPGADESHPAYLKFIYKNRLEKILGIRKYVYDYYLRVSGLRGNKEEYITGNIGNGIVYTSAHNSALDFMSRYGYVAGVLFVALQVLIIILGLNKVKDDTERVGYGEVLAVLVSTSFFAWGLFYSVAFTGEIMDTLFWVSAAFVMSKRCLCNSSEEAKYNKNS